MGFLSGRKSVDVEKHLLDIRSTINSLEMMVRKHRAECDRNLELARAAVREGDNALARIYVQNAESLRSRRIQIQQQIVTLRSAQLQIEEARSQQDILKAIRRSREVLEKAAEAISPTEIRTELDRLGRAMDRLSLAGDILSEEVTPVPSDAGVQSAVDQRLASIEAEVMLEKAQALPSLRDRLVASQETDSEPLNESTDEKIDEVIARLAPEAQSEPEQQIEL